jgi:hypothetical protein
MNLSNSTSMNDLILTPVPWEKMKEAIQEIVFTALQAQKTAETEERLLSPSETCNLFQPKISKTTLASWTKQGLLQEHRYGGRVYYRYGEVLTAAKTLKRYARN